MTIDAPDDDIFADPLGFRPVFFNVVVHCVPLTAMSVSRDNSSWPDRHSNVLGVTTDGAGALIVHGLHGPVAGYAPGRWLEFTCEQIEPEPDAPAG